MKQLILLTAMAWMGSTATAQYYGSFRVEPNYPQEQKTITINNKTYQAKEVQIYVLNRQTYKWEYLQTKRIPGGGTFSFAIGQYEQVYDYGYFIDGSYPNLINKFGNYPLNLY